jgi:hypothetical protein
MPAAWLASVSHWASGGVSSTSPAMVPAPATFEAWLDETFGRAIAGESYPQFVHREVEDWPDPVPDKDALQYLIRLFENPEESLRYFSDAQIAAGLWELSSGDVHCVNNRDIAIEDRERLIGSVATFFRDFFDKRCVPQLSNNATEHLSPLNTICYMWWEVIHIGGAKDDPDADRLNARAMGVKELVLALPNPACKEAALHGLGHLVRHSDRAHAIIESFLRTRPDPELEDYARAALTGCIQ